MSDVTTRPSLRLLRIEETKARKGEDSVQILVDRLSCHEEYYPGISNWIRRKVLPGLRSGERVGYVGIEDDRPILAAVLKRGARTKFCHVSVEEGFKSNRYGSLLFSLMAAEVRHTASEIHFTLPEGLWAREKAFFESFGFQNAVIAGQQYRLFEDELRCSAPFREVWTNVLAGLPGLLTAASISGYGFNDGVVLSVRESHARAIMDGRKTIEVRRRFSERWSGCRASVYASGGMAALLGEVTIEGVDRCSPEEAWERFAPDIGCTFESFVDYVGDKNEVFALRLGQAKPYASPVPLSQLSRLISSNLTPPQSYCSSAGSKSWGQALTAAALLHGSWTGTPNDEDRTLDTAGTDPMTPGTPAQYALNL